MAWPFTTPANPPTSTAVGATVPTSIGTVITGDVWMLGAHFTNQSASERLVTVKDDSNAILCQVLIPPSSEQPYEWPFRPTTGIHWVTDGANVLGQIWWY